MNPDLSARLVECTAGPCGAVHGGRQWSLIGPELHRLGEYVPADVNDAWYPPADAVHEALHAAVDSIQHTPAVGSERLRDEVAAMLDTPSGEILIGAGASALLHHLIGCAAPAGSTVLLPAPTYSEYERVARASGARVVRLLLEVESGFAIDPDELAEAARLSGATLVVLANPNNPTGAVLDGNAMDTLLAALPHGCRLLVDEAYIDWTPRASAWSRTPSAPALAVVRSLSKGPALAGLRAGHARLGEGWRDAHEWIAPPWPVGLPAQAAWLAALRTHEHVHERIEATRLLRDALREDLAALDGLEPLPTCAHYFLVRLHAPWPGAPDVVAALSDRRVLVRDGTAFGPPLGDEWLRVTTRSAEENTRVQQAFSDVRP